MKTIVERRMARVEGQAFTRRGARAETNHDRFNRVMDMVADSYGDASSLFARIGSTDEALIHLHRMLNDIGMNTMCAVHAVGSQREGSFIGLHANLQTMVAFSVAWLVSSQESPDHDAVLGRIFAERERQRRLFLEKKISFDVANSLPDPRRKFRVLAEEVGEVAHAIDQIENHGMAAGNLHMELVQVAAVAVAWLESFEVAR